MLALLVPGVGMGGGNAGNTPKPTTLPFLFSETVSS